MHFEIRFKKCKHQAGKNKASHFPRQVLCQLFTKYVLLRFWNSRMNSLEYRQLEGNKTRSERQLVLFKPEIVSCRDDDEPEGALKILGLKNEILEHKFSSDQKTASVILKMSKI